MDANALRIRLMQSEDLDAVVEIDAKVLGTPRRDYYEQRFDKLFRTSDYLPASLVAENAEGAVVGFVMGELFIGEYGISREGATLDTIGVDPACQHGGVGAQLIGEFVDHLRRLGVEKVNTLVGWDDVKLVRFFSANQFRPSTTINLERGL